MSVDASDTDRYNNGVDLLNARYGLYDLPAPLLWNETLETLLAHRSVRAYLSDALPEGTLELLIAAAQSASSSSNLQVWSVVSVEDLARKERLSKFAGDQNHIRQAPLFLVWLADVARMRRVANNRTLSAEGLDYTEMFIVAAVDAALAAQNATIAAESLGLGTVYIGAVRNNPEKVAAELGLPQGVFPLFGLCVGYPDPARPASIKPRLPQPAVLHRERYSMEQDQSVAEYDTVMTRFYAEQRMNQPSWTQHSVDRVRNAQSLKGRDRLRETLQKMGFPLR